MSVRRERRQGIPVNVLRAQHAADEQQRAEFAADKAELVEATKGYMDAMLSGDMAAAVALKPAADAAVTAFKAKWGDRR